MPVLKVYGLSCLTMEPRRAILLTVIEALKGAVSMVPELRLEPRQVSVWLIPDMLPERPEMEIIVFVDGLLAFPNRTAEVRTALAAKVEECLRALFPEASLVEVFVRTVHATEDHFPI